MTQQETYSVLLDMLDRLSQAGVYFRLRYSLPRAISVDVDMGDGRWEVDYWEDGEVYIEKFVSREGVGGGEMMAELNRDIDECLAERKEFKQNNGVDAG